MKTHIITIATNSELYFPYLVDSCKKNGIPLTVLGYGEKWTGFTFRFDKMIQYLKKLDPNDIVCFIDGYDVICVRNLHEMTDVFLQLKKKNNETHCFYYIFTPKCINKYFCAKAQCSI